MTHNDHIYKELSEAANDDTETEFERQLRALVMPEIKAGRQDPYLLMRVIGNLTKVLAMSIAAYAHCESNLLDRLSKAVESSLLQQIARYNRIMNTVAEDKARARNRSHELSSAAAMQKKHYVADNRRKADAALTLLGHWLEGKL
jgi:hypothetical protein